MSPATIFSIIIDLAALICSLFALMLSYYRLLKRIADHFAAYYRQLGLPFLPTASWAILKTIKNDRPNYKLLRQLLTGLPADFPNDLQLKRSARVIKLEILTIIGLILIGIIGATIAVL